MVRTQQAIARRTAWVLALAGLLAGCGGATVSGTTGDAGGSGGHSNGTGGVAAGGSSAGAGGGVGTGGSGGCPAGYADCNGDPSDGCETHIESDPGHCGACGIACTSPPGGAVQCVNGACQMQTCGCPVGRGDCNHDCADGCEIDLTSDVNNCGFCGNACKLPNATAACVKGKCTIAACDKGFADCDKFPTDGCEKNLETDQENCGSCGNVCSTAGNATCDHGMCSFMCCDQKGFANCNGNCNNCVDLGNDPDNCGFCGNVCSVKNGTAACVNGQCAIGACNAGFADCDQKYPDGCETSLSTQANCGACGNACVCGTCISGKCSVAACSAGFADCDGNPATCCETNLMTDAKNCGGCGHACAAGHSCVAGGCQ